MVQATNHQAERFNFLVFVQARRCRRGFIFDDFEKSIYTGVKGMPGRNGIGIGHNERSCYYPDKDNRVLKSWIVTKDDYNKYLKVREELS